MSHDKIENSDSPEAATDLFDPLRENHSQQNPLPHPLPHQRQQNAVDELSAPSTENLPPEDKASAENPPDSDSGSMPPEARRALVSLLRQGVILASQKTKLFDSICRYQPAVRSHLADIYLKLVLDEKAGVAFVATLDESDDEDEEAVSLISRRTLSLYDTLLLLVLRKHYQERESTGEQRVIIDIERVEANLSPFLPLTNSTKSDRKKLNAALQKMTEKRVLSSVRGSDERFEITPIIRYVVNAEFLEGMLEEYQRLSQEAGLNHTLPESNQEESVNLGDNDE